MSIKKSLEQARSLCVKLIKGRRGVAALLALIALASAPTTAFSQAWPTKPVTIIVPFPPGGNTDTMARMLAQKFTERFGQNFLVENRVGASGSIGTTAATRAAADGYTLMFGAFQQISVLPYTEKVSYDPKTDLAYVSIFGEGPFVLGVNASVPVKNLKEFIAYAKSRPGDMAFASGGVFSGAHLVPALFFAKAGISLNHVPYRGGGPAIADLLGNHVQAYFGNASELIPIATDSRVRLLAVSSEKRMEQLLEVPTVNELFPGFVMSAWNGLMAPAKTPKEVLDRLEQATIEAARDPQVKTILGNLGITTVGGTSKDFVDRIARENEFLQDAIKAAQSSVK
jgi:tripartite-type tricarboxylate transporter receptor subunit TctC